MKIEIAFCLLGLAFLPACTTTQTAQTTNAHQTLEQRLKAKYAAKPTAPGTEPAPPAEGPDDVPADAPDNVDHNPALMPSPLLRYSAASRTP